MTIQRFEVRLENGGTESAEASDFEVREGVLFLWDFEIRLSKAAALPDLVVMFAAGQWISCRKMIDDRWTEATRAVSAS